MKEAKTENTHMEHKERNEDKTRRRKYEHRLGNTKQILKPVKTSQLFHNHTAILKFMVITENLKVKN